MARTTPEATPEQTPIEAAAAAPQFKKVIIQRPYGVTDSHIFIGFNLFEGQFAYEQPVNLPVEVINHLRSLRRVEYRPDESGNPTPSYSNMLSVVDAE